MSGDPSETWNIPPGRAHCRQHRDSAWHFNSVPVDSDPHAGNSSA